MQGRIWFPGNPWPEGHPIAEFSWTARLDESQRLWFDLDLKSAGYFAEREIPDDEETDGGDFSAPIVWGNYHACRISSTWDDATGILAANAKRPFSFTDPRPHRLTADHLPITDLDAPAAFYIYLLGHDSVAEHEVEFTKQDNGSYRIDWIGRIALTYIGEEEYKHTFRAEIHDVALGQISYPATMSAEEAQKHLATIIGDEDPPAPLVATPNA